MKIHWKNSNAEGVKRQIAQYLSGPYRCSVQTQRVNDAGQVIGFATVDGSLSYAQAWVNAAELAWSYQLDIDPPPTTASDRVAALRAAGAWEELNEANRNEGLGFEADREAKALIRWTAMRRWASEPSSAERAAESLKQAEAARMEAEVEARALAIVAAENAAALERARKQARKELAQ